jgi:peptidoglycan/LPS O-acetylase OafA/YrhL
MVGAALTTLRNKRIDGLRAFAVLGVMWHHWTPAAWKGPFPFEIGLFFFLTLTGFLVTGILLRAREEAGHAAAPWRLRSHISFLRRRFGRVLLPSLAAMFFAAAVGAADVIAHPFAYALHVSNFHMAFSRDWPSGTAPFWSLAVQMQFYVLWPFAVFLVPRRCLPWFFALCLLLAPLCRFVLLHWFPGVHHPEALTPTALDYFGAGALLAWLFRAGVAADDPRFSKIGWAAFAGYAVLYSLAESGHELPHLCHFQQTFLAISCASLIAATFGAWSGPGDGLLMHPAVQHVGRVSYGLYLFHAAVPLALGKALPWLWTCPVPGGPLLVARIAAFSATSFVLAEACWRWGEKPRNPPAA